MKRLQRGYIALKGFAVVTLISLATYAVISGVRLAERYVAAVELGERYFVSYDSPNILVDKKEKVFYRWDKKIGEYVKLKE